MTNNQQTDRYDEYRTEYELLDRLSEAYERIGQVANLFESCEEMDFANGHHFGGAFAESMDNLDEFASFEVKSRIEDIAWQIQDRDYLENLGFDTSWWERGNVEQLQEYLAQRDGDDPQVVDCE